MSPRAYDHERRQTLRGKAHAAHSRRTPGGVRLIRAHHLGMCFGVVRAIDQAVAAAARQPVTILGDLVHNEAVLEDLRAQGLQMCRDIADVQTEAVMITAHGASTRRHHELQAAGLRVIDTTCPLVRAAHRAIAMLVADDRHPVIVGRRGHTEVTGMTEDLTAYDIVLTAEDVASLHPHPRIGIVAQTTQPVERVEHLAALIRARFPESDVALVNTVCVPTRLRQQSAEDLAAQSDVVVVVGGPSSNNTRELAETCRRHCGRVYLVATADDLQPAWLTSARVIGLTAGTSTPGHVVDDVERRLLSLADTHAAARGWKTTTVVASGFSRTQITAGRSRRPRRNNALTDLCAQSPREPRQ